MSTETEDHVELSENISELIENLKEELRELYVYRDLFFENHPLEKASERNKCVEQKKEKLVQKFESIDVDSQIPCSLRAEFLYLKGKCYNVSRTYDPRATQCLSKAVKLNPQLIAAWNELGECYLKNLNVKEAKATFEGALKHERNRLSLRCLSIILRHEVGNEKQRDINAAILKSVELAKEAVAQDIKDGLSWNVLGNAYLSQFFMVEQDPATFKLCMSAYKQAWLDPIAKGQPDLYYNRGIALKYEECYSEAIEMFEQACRLDPSWAQAKSELADLTHFLKEATQIVRTRGKLKPKRLNNMIQSIDMKMLGEYSPGTFHTFGARKDVLLEHTTIDKLNEGTNEGKVILGRVVGSIRNETSVPFAFALTDASAHCVCVTVYNWADGRGVIVGDAVAVPEPVLCTRASQHDSVQFNFKSIRVNNPLVLLVNGRRVSRVQFASTRVSSTYEVL